MIKSPWLRLAMLFLSCEIVAGALNLVLTLLKQFEKLDDFDRFIDSIDFLNRCLWEGTDTRTITSKRQRQRKQSPASWMMQGKTRHKLYVWHSWSSGSVDRSSLKAVFRKFEVVDGREIHSNWISSALTLLVIIGSEELSSRKSVVLCILGKSCSWMFKSVK